MVFLGTTDQGAAGATAAVDAGETASARNEGQTGTLAGSPLVRNPANRSSTPGSTQ